MDGVAGRLRAAGCVFAEDEARLLIDAAAGERLEELIRRRVAGEPLEQLLGWAEFCGLRIPVAPGVFVPRRRSALLVHRAVEIAPNGATVVDLCCGTGALGAAVAARRPDVTVHAADLDPVAVACARRSLAAVRSGERGPHVYRGDLFTALPPALEGEVDVLLVNAPYVPTADIAAMPGEARDHEARLALDGGADGLDVQRRVAAGAPRWLRPGGTLLLETSRVQAARAAELLAAAGLLPSVLRDDDLDATAVAGTRPQP